MNDNMAKKLAIIEQAEALKGSTDWKKTSDALIDLQRQWKEIGRALIEEIEAYVPVDAEADAEAARGFAERWSAIGFVPFKEKEAVGAAYKAAMQAKFPEWGRGGRREGGRGPVREPRRNQPLTEKDKLTLKYNQLQQDIQTYENNIGFFGLSKGAEHPRAAQQPAAHREGQAHPQVQPAPAGHPDLREQHRLLRSVEGRRTAQGPDAAAHRCRQGRPQEAGG